MSDASSHPLIGDYAFISDCHSAALVSRGGSIDWCCMPRIDSGSCFGRLLDRERGGFCSISPGGEGGASYWRYLDGSLVLETTFETSSGEARLFDCLVMREGGRENPYHQLLRIVEGVRGRVDLRLLVAPRFDYGAISPWLRQEGLRRYSAIGGNDALLISGDPEIAPIAKHELGTSFTVRPGERMRVSIEYLNPERLDYALPAELGSQELDDRLEETLDWWDRWSSRVRTGGPQSTGVLKSATVLKGLTYAPTGAIAAAPTTSLPEKPGGSLNWDYRYSWIRDSFFSVRSLAEIGFDLEADGFRRFIQRSAAGNAGELRIMYGVGGERRLEESTLPLEGYRGAEPVRIGNAASSQLQLDMYGELLELSWLWHKRGNSFDDDHWRFLLELVNAAAELWVEPDHGFWEIRGEPQHFVRSKVMCWAALDRGVKLAEESLRQAPLEHWRETRDEIRAAVENQGYDEKRGTFVQAFGSVELDAALLLIPKVGFIDYDDERMLRTTDAICEDLDDNGLLKRYRGDEEEGAFLACSFWLAECLAHQGRIEDARAVFDRAASTANDLGLFSEEYDTANFEMLGNFPQGLTHLSHISAAAAIDNAVPAKGSLRNSG